MKKIVFIIILSIIFFACSKEKRSDKAAEKMQNFVIKISNYARGLDHDFIIIPQNGIELTFNNCDTINGYNSEYLAAIDGVGIESLFYEGNIVEDDGRLTMARKIKSASKKILVSDFINNNSDINNSFQRSISEGFICFPRNSSNYDYIQIPDSVSNSSSNNIVTLDQAQNYLYLISTDNFQSKQEMINAIKATNYDVILIDLFFNDDEFTSSEINQLKIKNNGSSRLVISYISIGSAEKYRYYWKKGWGRHHPLFIKRKYEGYDDEFWVKFWKKGWEEIIYGNDNSYIKKIINAGFDGAYLDNVEAFYFLYYKD